MKTPLPSKNLVPHRSARTWPLLRMVGSLGIFVQAATALAASFYVDAIRGDDHRDGTSEKTAWRSLERASHAPLQAGDSLLLAGGQTHAGELLLSGRKGTAASSISLSSYGPDHEARCAPAAIDGRGKKAALHLVDCSHVTISNLVVTADGGGEKDPTGKAFDMRCGVLIESTSRGEAGGIELTDVHVSGVSYHDPGFHRPLDDVKTPNGNARYGFGVRFIVHGERSVMRQIAVRNCTIDRVDHTGLKFTAPSGGVKGVEVDRLRISETGGPGVQFSGVEDGHISRICVDHSGSENDSRNWGRGSGLWTWDCRNVVIEHSEFTNASGPGDSAGVHIDYRCRDVVVQYNFSANNAGGFCEILGDSYNCAYRYNVSVNDGYRVKGKNGAFQDGKLFWLSGYVGKEKPRGPFNSYFYNNTIFVAEGIESKIAIAPTAEGVLIANNIFCLQGPSRMVAGDQLRAEQHGGDAQRRVFFANNAFLRADNWPAEFGIQDATPLLGDPAFMKPGGLKALDYLPSNAALVKNRGIRITNLVGDDAGLRVGLDATFDFRGNPITGSPDLGAFELP